LRLGTDAAVPVVLGPCLAISRMKSPIGGKEKFYFYEAPRKKMKVEDTAIALLEANKRGLI
jgi:hypothetical protein